MCEVLDRVEQRGMEKGYAAGRIAGRNEGKIDALYHELGMSVSIMYPIRWTRRDEGIA